MINEITARMWGIFDETGIFLALCRHGFVLVVADMVRSGELYVMFRASPVAC
jgi:Kyakuja-Dileera-Zisupton transposase